MTEFTPPTTRRLFPLFRSVFGFASACFAGALVTDIVYADNADMQWSNFSMWLITAGLIVAALAAIVGLVELATSRPGHWFRTGWALPVGSAAASIVSVFNAFVHSRDAYESVVPTGLTLSIVVVVILLLIPFFERGARAARFA
ncbi:MULTISPECIES: DUF2231 domain-containing protein [Sphingosinicellaceae]|uniref:DUF2231 domain-containing protein n=1 Tax=Sphingosinicellaceae TaxID=2820280 RepID=UPI001C1E53DF|nr:MULTISPECIES: DUF2231 domain-containing protein [Polymorphobacter]QYE36612.1 DUF2231 domain-containing protein [Polymorphobacter sp. PAMC 29334]UAJ08744.1 DUF2231 domain-containing protein [Polymorphobacter megasporae]